ncbi:MAG: hypothetical protein ACR2GH_19350 [Pseudonocardia sp.]
MEWDSGSPDGRRWLYEVVLREGDLNDVRTLVDGRELVRVWDRLYLPRWVRDAWAPLIDAARSAA